MGRFSPNQVCLMKGEILFRSIIGEVMRGKFFGKRALPTLGSGRTIVSLSS